MSIADFLATVHPWDGMTQANLDDLATKVETIQIDAGDLVYTLGDPLAGLYFVRSGIVEVTDVSGAVLSSLGPRNAFGERGLLRDGRAATTARATTAAELLLLPTPRFTEILTSDPALVDFFARTRPPAVRPRGLSEMPIADLMTPDPLSVGPGTTLAAAARLMRDRRVSSLLVVEGGALLGILTLRDLSTRVVADGLGSDRPVTCAMTTDPVTLPPEAIGSDVLHLMMERGIGHVPIIGAGGLAGIVTKTDLTRFQAADSAGLVSEAAAAPDVEALAAITRRIPQLLAQLVGSGHRHDSVTRLVTDVADVVTRRLLALTEAALGPPPVSYLWLACGSQGRREQTGASDQDNVLILSDDATETDGLYFAGFADRVTAGLDRCGYVFCPGKMMASAPRWRQPTQIWRRYFEDWIARPDPMAQMLASVMFDLRPIGGDETLFEGLRSATLQAASRNSIFVSHMIANSLTHSPPLGLFRGLSTLRSGEHRDRIDLKLNGVVPIVDLGRIYALRGALTAVNTRTRIEAARAAGIVSESGGSDLLAAYDLIARTRLEHQARQVRDGEVPDNFMVPGRLSAFERSHLRDAFVIVRTMQSAAAQGRGLP